MEQRYIKSVKKRDGRMMPFDPERIKNAIIKAMESADPETGTSLSEVNKLVGTITECLDDICRNEETDCLPVTKVHDMVETVLMRESHPDVARQYVRYRVERTIARKADSNAIFKSIMLAQANDITRENANMNADTPAGMMMKFASETTKTYVDENLLSEPVKEAVKANLLHIHDKDYYPTKSLTCIQHPTDKLLREGAVIGHAAHRPAKHLETAADLACIGMETVQNEMHGGQAIPAFDFYLAPYVRKTYEEEVDRLRADLRGIMPTTSINSDIEMEAPSDEESIVTVSYDRFFDMIKNTSIDDYIKEDVDEEIMATDDYNYYNVLAARISQIAVNRTVRRVHQTMEAFVHKMNTIHSRGGNQVVFSSINYGTDTSPEGRCIIREILNTTYEGIGNGETAIFPIQIWKKKRGVSYLPGDPNYDLYCFACKVTAKRFYPNFLNLDATFNQDDAWEADDPRRFEHEVATMGCRTRVYENRFGPKTSIGRGNLSFSTLNLPGLAIQTVKEMGAEFGSNRPEVIEAFFDRLQKLEDVTALQLHQRFEFQSSALAKQFPMLMSGMWLGSENLKPTDTVASVINQGTLGIGFIGLAECLVALTGKHHAESPQAQELGLRIVTFLRDNVNRYCEKYKHNYSVLATPAEGLSGKFTKVDRKRYGQIPGVTDKEYYTNSNHVPVFYHCTPEEKARIEAPYHDLTRGGHIFYIEMNGDATHNPEAIMQIVDLMDKYNMGYGSVNHNRARCLDCGYETGQKGITVCPKCGSKNIDLLQRITGYLVGTTERWNSAKKAELRDRVTHE